MSDTHIDNKLLAQYSDSIHECALLKDQLLEHVRQDADLPTFRFCFLWEHKSHKPYEPIESQKERYRYAIIGSDIKNKKHPSIVIPILLYHGATQWDKKMLYDKFEPYLPPEILDFIPRPKYIVIDIQAMNEENIEKMVDLGVLRAAFVTLKNAHKKNFFKQNMEKALKFVETLPTEYVFQEFFKMLLEYMQRRSGLEAKEFNEIVEQKLNQNMTTNIKTIFEVVEERGIERGIEQNRRENVIKLWQKGIEPNMISNLLDLSIEQIEAYIVASQKQEKPAENS